jgi:ankyrin repeat protein
LLKAGAEKDIRNIPGWTALSYATENKDQACIQLLLKAGAASADAAMSSLVLLGDVEEGGIVGAGGKQRELQGDVEGSVESMMGALVVVEARGSNKEQSQGVRCTHNTNVSMHTYVHARTHAQHKTHTRTHTHTCESFT